MRNISLLTFVLVTALTGCKKNHTCHCKASDSKFQDFSNDIKATKKNAKITCNNQNAFWSPEYTCTLK